MKSLVKLEAVLAGVSFALIFVTGAVGQVAIHAGMDPKSADFMVHAAILLLFCIFGFSCIGLMLHVFVKLQVGIGNRAVPMIHFLASHERGVTFAVWGFLGLGTLIALPFALQDMGMQLPIGRSQGVLSADIGMTLDEVRQRSSVKMKEPRLMGDTSHMSVEQMVFDFKIGDSPVHFPQSRYYWLETPKHDTHITVLNIGITPRKIPKPELETFQDAARQQLVADGWMPGHYVASSEETVRMWGGKRTIRDGDYWRKGGTLLMFETKRMDEQKRDEPPGAGEFIVDLHLRPKDYDKDLVFEPSAWNPSSRK